MNLEIALVVEHSGEDHIGVEQQSMFFGLFFYKPLNAGVQMIDVPHAAGGITQRAYQ